jgi:hypothetical protein
LTAEELLEAIANSPLERLRWLVLSRFNVLPGSKQAGELSDEDVIVCGAHMVLEQRGKRTLSGGFETGVNSSFERARFAGLSGGE